MEEADGARQRRFPRDDPAGGGRDPRRRPQLRPAASRRPRIRSATTRSRSPTSWRERPAQTHSRRAAEGLVPRAACRPRRPPGRSGATPSRRWTCAPIRRTCRRSSASPGPGPATPACCGGDFGTAYCERGEIYDFVRARGITGFATVSGDRHSFWAGLAAKALPPQAFEPVGVAFVTGSISAPGVVEALEHSLPQDHPLRPLFLARAPHEERPRPTLNMLLRHGVRSCLEYARSGDLEAARRASNPELAPHVSFVDMGGHGYSVVTASAATRSRPSSSASRARSSAANARTAARCATACATARRCGAPASRRASPPRCSRAACRCRSERVRSARGRVRSQSRRRVTTKASSLNHRPPCFCSTVCVAVEVGAVRHDRIQPLVLDLIDVDGGIPGGEQRRGADAVADLRGQRVHLVAEHRLLVRRRGEVELARIASQLAPAASASSSWRSTWNGCSSRPQLLDDLQRRIVAVGLDRQQPPARARGCAPAARAPSATLNSAPMRARQGCEAMTRS